MTDRPEAFIVYVVLVPLLLAPLSAAFTPPADADVSTSNTFLPPHPHVGADYLAEVLSSSLEGPSLGGAELTPDATPVIGDTMDHLWPDWSRLLDEDPLDLPEHVARLTALELPPSQCRDTRTLELGEAIVLLGDALGAPNHLNDDFVIVDETRTAFARLITCLALHIHLLPDISEETVIPDAATRASWLGTLRDLLQLIRGLQFIGIPMGVNCVDANCLIKAGGPGNDVYEDDAVLVIDSGGNDTYLNNAGGASPLTLGIPIAVLIDQRDGDDRYWPERTDLFEYPTIGSGYLGGIGVLVDEGGGDHYRGLGTTMGSGYLGTGFLLSRDGNDFFESPHPDEYESVMDPTQSHKVSMGAGAYGGYGFLVNERGDDRYLQNGLDSIGWGGARGLGMLLELGGHDSYTVSPAPAGNLIGEEFGNVSGVSVGVGEIGGVGIVLDRDGGDTYTCMGEMIYGCIGVGHWGGFGLVHDRDGDDNYSLPPLIMAEGGLGAALLGGTGVFVDEDGADAYTSRAPSSGGSGSLGGVGLFLDLGGPDDYNFVSPPWLGERADDNLWVGDIEHGALGASGHGLDWDPI